MEAENENENPKQYIRVKSVAIFALGQNKKANKNIINYLNKNLFHAMFFEEKDESGKTYIVWFNDSISGTIEICNGIEQYNFVQIKREGDKAICRRYAVPEGHRFSFDSCTISEETIEADNAFDFWGQAAEKFSIPEFIGLAEKAAITYKLTKVLIPDDEEAVFMIDAIMTEDPTTLPTLVQDKLGMYGHKLYSLHEYNLKYAAEYGDGPIGN